MLFDLWTRLQRARRQEQPGVKQDALSRLRQSAGAEPTAATPKPEESEVSRQLALAFLLSSDDNWRQD